MLLSLCGLVTVSASLNSLIDVILQERRKYQLQARLLRLDADTATLVASDGVSIIFLRRGVCVVFGRRAAHPGREGRVGAGEEGRLAVLRVFYLIVIRDTRRRRGAHASAAITAAAQASADCGFSAVMRLPALHTCDVQGSPFLKTAPSFANSSSMKTVLALTRAQINQ